MKDVHFEKLVDQHAEAVFNLALNYLQQKEDAEEVVQDVFLKVHQQLHGFNQQSEMRTWVFRIAINQCLDVLRKRKRIRQPKFVGENFDELEKFNLVKGDYDHPGILLEHKEGLDLLFDAINQLPSLQKQVVLLKYTEDFTVAELSKVLEKSEKACESLLTRARKNLGEIIKMSKDAKR